MKDKFFRAPEVSPTDGVILDVDKASTELDLALQRDIKNILIESSKGKLNAGSARDLINYIDLVERLKKLRASTLASMTPEQLKAIAEQK